VVNFQHVANIKGPSTSTKGFIKKLDIFILIKIIYSYFKYVLVFKNIRF